MPKKHLRKARAKLKELLNLKGSPHTIALGAAVGIFWNFIPSLGIGPFLAIGLAKLLRASAVASLTANLATGIFIPVLYSMNMITGRLIKGEKVETTEIEESLQDSFQESITIMEDIVEKPTSFFSLDTFQNFTSEFLVGAIVNAILVATIVYVIFWLILNRRYNGSKKQSNLFNKRGGYDV